MAERRVRDRYVGVVLGLAAGDALGAPFHGMFRSEIEERHGKIRDMASGGNFGVERGQWTFPAAQALQTLESIMACRGVDGEDLSLRLVELSDLHPIGIDPFTARVLDTVVEDPDGWETAPLTPWHESAATFCNHTALTRAPIVALRGAGDMDKLVEDVIRVCRVTHVDPRCIDASIAIAFAVVQCLYDRVDKDFIPKVRQFVATARKGETYKTLALSFDPAAIATQSTYSGFQDYREDKDAVLDALDALPQLGYDELGVSPYCVHAMQTALWCLTNTESVERAIRKAVSLGGETTVSGALAGALAGARHGFSDLPQQWLSPLKERAKFASLGEMLASEMASSFAE